MPGLWPFNLRTMSVDYVDILYLPNAAKKESVMFEPLMKVTEKIRKAGKARFLGIGTHSYVPEAVRAAADSNFWDIVMLAYNIKERIQDIIRLRDSPHVRHFFAGEAPNADQPLSHFHHSPQNQKTRKTS